MSAALSLIFSASAASSYAAAIPVVDESSATGGGWQVSPDPGNTFDITGANLDQTLAIQKEWATSQSGSDILDPPLGTGADHGGTESGTAPTTVNYSASQLNGTTSNGGGNPADDPPTLTDPPAGLGSNSNADFTLEQSPAGTVGEVVSSPLAAWQVLAGLTVVALLTLRAPTTAKASA
jgi:hypothetical protein